MSEENTCIPATNSLPNHPVDQLAALWMMRVLLNLGGWRNMNEFLADNILMALDMRYLDDSDISAAERLDALKRKQEKLESSGIKLKGVFKRNLKKLGKLIGLSRMEIKILAFAIVLHQHQGLDDAADKLNELTTDRVIDVISFILRLRSEKVRAALSTKGLLSRSGLLHYFIQSKAGELVPSDFKYIQDDYTLITKYLGTVQTDRRPGVNILLYGAPGTGKSQLARVIARDLGLTLFEINMNYPDGDPLNGSHRFSAYQLGQQVLARQSDALLLFDEIEDVFPVKFPTIFGRIGSNDGRKAWINRLLEENPVPAIWISNSIEQIDNAFIRRFDYVLKLGHPPRKIRADIFKKHLQHVPVSEQWIERVAGNPNLAPAIITRAARIACAHDTGKDGAVERDLERVLSNTLGAMGFSDKIEDDTGNETPYHLAAINPDQDIYKLVDGIKRHPHGRFCVYGPPGTGKTEFGRFIARELDKPLLVKRASDLLDPYVGMTEKNIAGMFNEATSDDSVLLLDEADSFLRDRGSAQRSWEVTQVNELLTQMERFKGLFICSTNLIDRLDSASIRRFDFKIRLSYLKPSQAWLLFCETLNTVEASIPGGNDLQARLETFKNLTPGDFATIVRQNRLSGDQLTPETLLHGLASESRFKAPKTCRSIGFTANI
jgi:SpoVK/Ycf46/Vps4 family AAA+-type ATPase